jgi:putative acetyltransferase
MVFRIGLGDPVRPDIVALLEQGEAYAASLYPAESNHFLSIEALRAENVRFVAARDAAGLAVGTGAVALNDG